MITCTLGEKKYTMDFVSGRALREMGPAAKTYGKLVRLSQDAVEGKDIAEEQMTVTDALDTIVRWFCMNPYQEYRAEHPFIPLTASISGL